MSGWFSRSGARPGSGGGQAHNGSEAGGGAASMLAGPLVVLGALRLGFLSPGEGFFASAAAEIAGLAGLILASLFGGSLAHLDRAGSVASRLLGRRVRYLATLLERFSYADGPTHSAVWSVGVASVVVPASYALFGAYGGAVVVVAAVGHLCHLLCDLVVYRQEIALLWPFVGERVRFGGGGPGRLSALLSSVAGLLFGLLGAFVAYTELSTLVEAVEAGVAGRAADGVVGFFSGMSGQKMAGLVGFGGGVAVFVVLLGLAPRVGEKAADKASRRGEYGGLEVYGIRPHGQEIELDPGRSGRLVGGLPIPPEGFFPEFAIGESVGACVSGRGIGELKERLEAEYKMEATVMSVGSDAALVRPPGVRNSEGAAHADGEVEDEPAEGGKDAESDPSDGGDGYAKVAAVFKLAGEDFRRGTLGFSEFGREDPLGGALNAVRGVLDISGGERALVQLCLRQANEASKEVLYARISEIDEKSKASKSSAKKRRRGIIWWFLALSPFGRARDIFNRESLRSEMAERGEELSQEERDEHKALVARKGHPLFIVELRVLAWLANQEKADSFVRAAAGYARSFDRFGGAGWELADSRIGNSDLATRIALRLAGPPVGRDEKRDLVTEEEITAMWHPLGSGVKVEARDAAKLVTKAPYAGIPTEGIKVGEADHPGYEGFPLLIEDEELDTSGELIGETGNGKSTMILSMLLPAICSGVGASLFDPKGGDLFTEVVSALPDLPAEVLDKTILFDPGEDRFPCPVLNFLDPFSYMSADDQAETIVRALEYRFPDGFGHNMRPIFVRAALAAIAANAKLKAAGLPPKFGLLDLTETGFLEPRIEVGNPKEGDYEQPPVRAEVLSHLRGDPQWEEIVRYWDTKDTNQSSGQQSKEWNPITNKIGQLKNRNVAKVLGSGPSSVDLMDVLQNGKLLLFNLSQGSMAGDAHELLGTLVLNLIMRTAAIRHDRAVRAGNPKSLTRFINVVDEVQNFLCPEMKKILTEGRAMRCSMWAAHQYMHQIRETDRSMAEAFANAGTTVLFGTTIDDAAKVAEFIDDPRFTKTVMANMPKYHFVLQRKDGEPVTGQTIPMPGVNRRRVDRVRQWSAETYAPLGPGEASTAAESAPANPRTPDFGGGSSEEDGGGGRGAHEGDKDPAGERETPTSDQGRHTGHVAGESGENLDDMPPSSPKDADVGEEEGRVQEEACEIDDMPKVRGKGHHIDGE